MRALAQLLRDHPLRALILLAWLAGWVAVLHLSLRPVDMPSGLSDKSLHFMGYALMTLVPAGFCRRPRALLAVGAATVAGSALIEGLQHLLPYRSFELLDIVANASGAALGTSLAVLAVTLLARRRAGVATSPSTS